MYFLKFIIGNVIWTSANPSVECDKFQENIPINTAITVICIKTFNEMVIIILYIYLI
jgi:hypothetical protein